MVKCKNYSRTEDYEKVNVFLERTYQKGGMYSNWLQPRWEYMHYHPALDESNLNKIALWFDGDKLVSMVNYESAPGDVYFQCDRDYSDLKPEMFDYAANHLFGTNDKGEKHVNLYINEFDEILIGLAMKNGYVRNEKYHECVTSLDLNEDIRTPDIPEGYHISDLMNSSDYHKLGTCMYAGFNHEGPLPEDDEKDRRLMHSSPGFRKDLFIIIESPNGEYAAIAGMWFNETNRIGYVEPVCTHPNHRRMKLGTAAVLEGAKRCVQSGAEEIFVESSLEFYHSMGFKHMYDRYVFQKKV